jgi:putative flippase GtrA
MTPPTTTASPPLLTKLLRFGGVSGISFVLNVGGFSLLHDLLNVRYEIAYAVSLLLVFVVNFFLFRFWVFKTDEKRPAGRQVLEYLVAAVSFRVTEYGMLLLLMSRLQVPATAAVIGISIVATLLKFFVFNGRVFKTGATSTSQPAHRLLPLLAAVLTGALSFKYSLYSLLRDWQFEYDIVQHATWAQQAWGAQLLALDPIARFYAETASPPAWRWLLTVLAPLGDLQQTLEVGAILLFWLTCWLLYRLGRATGDGLAGIWAGLFMIPCVFVLSRMSDLLPTSMLQRSFAVPLTVMLMLALHRRNMLLLGSVYIIAGLIYPIFVATGGFIGLVYEVIRVIRDRRLPPRWYLGAAGAVNGLLLVLVIREVPEAYGSTVSLAEARTMSIFGPEGRNRFWVDDPIHFWFTHHRTGLRLSPLTVAAGILLAGFSISLAGIRRVPMVAWVTLGGSLVLFLLAHALLFHLYLPNRHVAQTVPLAWALVIATTLPHAVLRIWRSLSWSVQTLHQLGIAGTIVLIAYCVVTTVPVVFNRGEASGPRLTIDYLRTLPPDTMIAGLVGHRNTDFLAFRTGRPVLANRETLLGYYPTFYREVMVPRVRASVDMYYAASWDEIDEIAREFDVRVFYWVGDALKVLPKDEPMRTMAYEAILRNGGEPPAMYEPPKDRILWWRGNVRAIRVGDGPTMPGVPPAEVPPFIDLPDVDPLDAIPPDFKPWRLDP